MQLKSLLNFVGAPSNNASQVSVPLLKVVLLLKDASKVFGVCQIINATSFVIFLFFL